MSDSLVQILQCVCGNSIPATWGVAASLVTFNCICCGLAKYKKLNLKQNLASLGCTIKLYFMLFSVISTLILCGIAWHGLFLIYPNSPYFEEVKQCSLWVLDAPFTSLDSYLGFIRSSCLAVANDDLFAEIKVNHCWLFFCFSQVDTCRYINK